MALFILFWLLAGACATPVVLMLKVVDQLVNRICGFTDCKNKVSLSLGFFLVLLLGGPVSLFFSAGGLLLLCLFLCGICLWELNNRHCKICKIPIMTVTLPHKKGLENEG